MAGIEIAVDRSWLVIFALITLSLAAHFAEAESWGRAASYGAAIITSLLFFASIVLHELGHSLTAQRFGLRVRSITLFVFGGVAALESEPRRPIHEIVIALAGPGVSLILGLTFSVLALWGALGDFATPVCAWLGRINLMLAAFNCVPGFPLDGGRVLRGLVWASTGSFERATTIAAGCGTVFAYALIFLGITTALLGGDWIGGLWLAFIGWFLLTASQASVRQLILEGALSKRIARDLCESVDDALVEGNETVASVIEERVLRRGRRSFYIVDRSRRLRGVVTLRELSRVAEADRRSTDIASVMVPRERVSALCPDDTAWEALKRIVANNVNQLPLVDSADRLLGVLTRERLLQVVEASAVLGARDRHRR